MALDYAKCAKEIFEAVGGRENLVSAAHCCGLSRLTTAESTRKSWKTSTGSRGCLTATDSSS